MNRSRLLFVIGTILLGNGGAFFGSAYITGRYGWAALGLAAEIAGGFTLDASNHLARERR